MANIVLIPNELSGLNYSIVPSVASNNLTVAIKDAAGNDPSASSPCVFRVGGSERILSTSLSVTKNAGTNWANLGGAELATKEADPFVYIVWNTNTSALDVLWSRMPNATLYSDFSATTTSERYGAINATAPASTDNVVNIGRFACTLSAGAGYTFSVPTFTSSNLVNRPIFETRHLSYTSALTWTAGAAPTGGTGLVYNYQIEGNKCFIKGQGYTMTAGTTVTVLTATLPFIPLLAAANGGVQLIPSHIGVAATQNVTMGEINYTGASLSIHCASCSATMFLWQGYYYI